MYTVSVKRNAWISLGVSQTYIEVQLGWKRGTYPVKLKFDIVRPSFPVQLKFEVRLASELRVDLRNPGIVLRPWFVQSMDWPRNPGGLLLRKA